MAVDDLILQTPFSFPRNTASDNLISSFINFSYEEKSVNTVMLEIPLPQVCRKFKNFICNTNST